MIISPDLKKLLEEQIEVIRITDEANKELLTENAALIFTSARIYGEEDSVIAELIRVANESTDASMRRKAAFSLSGFVSYPGVNQEISEVYKRDGFPVAAIGPGPEWLPWLLIIVILGVIIGCVYVLFALIL